MIPCFNTGKTIIFIQVIDLFLQDPDAKKADQLLRLATHPSKSLLIAVDAKSSSVRFITAAKSMNMRRYTKNKLITTKGSFWNGENESSRAREKS